MRDRNDSPVARGRYMARRKKDTHRPGAAGETAIGDFAEASGNQKNLSAQRKYPAGRRMFKAERTHAMGIRQLPVTGW